jgi:hypothetical protein
MKIQEAYCSVLSSLPFFLPFCLSLSTMNSTICNPPGKSALPARFSKKPRTRSDLRFQLMLLGLFCFSFSNSFSAVPMKTPNPWKYDDASLLHRVYHPRKVPKDGVDYIIIGSGIGGLWLRACLAKFNITSLVLEQHYIAGGFQHTFWKGPYEFVPSLHYIANLPLCAPLYDMVASNQVTYSQAGNSVPADRGEMCSHELKIGDLPVMQVRQGKENVRKELVRVFPEEERQLTSSLRSRKKPNGKQDYLRRSRFSQNGFNS